MQVPRCLFSPRTFMGEGLGERVSRFALSPTLSRKRERELKQPAYAGYSHDR